MYKAKIEKQEHRSWLFHYVTATNQEIILLCSLRVPMNSQTQYCLYLQNAEQWIITDEKKNFTLKLASSIVQVCRSFVRMRGWWPTLLPGTRWPNDVLPTGVSPQTGTTLWQSRSSDHNLQMCPLPPVNTVNLIWQNINTDITRHPPSPHTSLKPHIT